MPSKSTAKPNWLPLSGGHAVMLSRPRRRGAQSAPPPLRFLLFAPLGSAGFRALLCAGNWIGGRALIETGLAPAALIAELERALGGAELEGGA
jgi:hypothetical protein